MAEGSLGVFEVVRVDVAHPDMSWLHLLGQRLGPGVDINQEGLELYQLQTGDISLVQIYRDTVL